MGLTLAQILDHNATVDWRLLRCSYSPLEQQAKSTRVLKHNTPIAPAVRESPRRAELRQQHTDHVLSGRCLPGGFSTLNTTPYVVFVATFLLAVVSFHSIEKFVTSHGHSHCTMKWDILPVPCNVCCWLHSLLLISGDLLKKLLVGTLKALKQSCGLIHATLPNRPTIQVVEVQQLLVNKRYRGSVKCIVS